ncbi:MAG: HAD hydrolase-like protein [Chloroflexi bacterium]|nr:HAD hydrolase-like protein [Chloroflexota bacterium]
MRFKYLLWDFDGTLFDTYPALIQIIERALADLGGHETRQEIGRLLDITMDECFKVLLERHHLDAAAFDARLDFHYAQTTIHDRPPFPGAIRVCERVIAAGGRNYLFTHRGHKTLTELLDGYGVGGLLADRLSTADGYPLKPDPAGFIALIEKHDLPRDQVLAVGDRDLDVVAGQQAGVKTCLYDTVPSPGVHPDYLISSFEELENILEL